MSGLVTGNRQLAHQQYGHHRKHPEPGAVAGASEEVQAKALLHALILSDFWPRDLGSEQILRSFCDQLVGSLGSFYSDPNRGARIGNTTAIGVYLLVAQVDMKSQVLGPPVSIINASRKRPEFTQPQQR